MLNKFFWTVLFFLLSNVYVAKAQVYEFALLGGGSGYVGDLNPYKYADFSDAAIGLQYKTDFDRRSTLKIQLISGGATASDANSTYDYQQQRNLDFKTRINELSFSYEFNFFEFTPVGMHGYNFTPYLSAGLGIFTFNPYSLDGQELNPLRTEGQAEPYNLTSIAVPMAFGLKYRLMPKVVLFGELGYRLTFTDYIDDVSGYYADMSSASGVSQKYADRSGEAGYEDNLPGSQRGDLLKRDTYFFGVVGISISFVPSKCSYF